MSDRSWREETRAVHRVVALALPKVVAFDLSMAAQVFGHEDERLTYRFTVCAQHAGPVASTTGFALEATADLAALEHADTVIVPGYAPRDAPPEPVLAALRDAASRGTRIASVCVGAFALAAAGLLDGRAATTHWQHAEEFRARFPTVRLDPDVLYVDNGSILTSAGITAGIDLCLHLYQRDHGAAAASAVARRMVVAAHRPGGQAQFSRRPPPRADDRVVRTCDWAIAEMHRPLTVAQLARHAGMAARTFTRLFREEINMTPMQWLGIQRVLEARRLLEATDLTVDDIAHRCGLGSAVTLRTHLARELGTTPSAYRRAWRRHNEAPLTSR
jgi:transcriptional regulator GlxA family with amidase domain